MKKLTYILAVIGFTCAASGQTIAYGIRSGLDDPPTCYAQSHNAFINRTTGTLKICVSGAWAAVGGGVGDALTTNPLSQFAATTSAQLASVITNETGNTLLVYNTSPTLVTPTLGVAAATSINKVAITAPATGATLTIADGATLTASSSATVSGTNTGDQTNISGNAATATALAANPTDCSAGQFATTIAASGNLTCAQVDYSQLAGSNPAANVALSNLASVAINAALNTGAGVTATFAATAPAQTASAQAGTATNITASNAVAGSSNAGAAAGANVSLTAGSAARLTSGNANGGDIVATPGTGIGTGTSGNLRQVGGNFVLTNTAGNAGVLIKLNGNNAQFRSYNDSGDAAAYAYGFYDAQSNKITLSAQGATGLGLASDQRIAFSSSNSASTTSLDTGLSRIAAGVIGAGTGAQGSVAGSWRGTYYEIVAGANVASASTITPTGGIFHITGTTQITTINMPRAGFTGCLDLIPDGAYTFATGGNIGKASTAIVGQTQRVCTTDGTTWSPSY